MQASPRSVTGYTVYAWTVFLYRNIRVGSVFGAQVKAAYWRGSATRAERQDSLLIIHHFWQQAVACTERSKVSAGVGQDLEVDGCQLNAVMLANWESS